STRRCATAPTASARSRSALAVAPFARRRSWRPDRGTTWLTSVGWAAVSKVLVTGGAGFIGSNLVRGLLERGDDVVVLDNFATGSRENLADVESEVELVEGELRSYERVHAATRGVEVVFHQGALPSVPRSVQD